MGLEEVGKVKNGSMEAKTVTKPTKTWSASKISGPRGRAKAKNGSMEAKTVTKLAKTLSSSRISGFRRGHGGQEWIHGGQDCDQAN